MSLLIHICFPYIFLIRPVATMGAKRRPPPSPSVGAPSAGAASSSTAAPSAGGGADALPEPKKQRRQLQRRSSDAVIDRAIEDHFRHLSANERATMEVGGLTLRQRVVEDRQNLAACQRLGSSYWRLLAQEFTARTSGSAQSLSSDGETDCDDQLRTALALLHHKNPAQRSVEMLQAYLGQAAQFSRATLKFVCKTLSKPSSVKRTSMNSLMFCFMTYVCKWKLSEKHGDVIQTMTPLFDAALCAQYARVKSGASLQSFFKANRQEVGLVMHLADADAVLQADATQSWADACPAVTRLVTASASGKAIFGFAEQFVNAARFEDQIEGIISSLHGAAKITSRLVESCQARAREAVKTMGKEICKREIVIPLFKSHVKMVVSSYMQEVEMRMSAALKEQSVGYKDGLPVLPFESWFVDGDRALIPCKVNEDLLRKMHAARFRAQLQARNPTLLTCGDGVGRDQFWVRLLSCACAQRSIYISGLSFLMCERCFSHQSGEATLTRI